MLDLCYLSIFHLSFGLHWHRTILRPLELLSLSDPKAIRDDKRWKELIMWTYSVWNDDKPQSANFGRIRRQIEWDLDERTPSMIQLHIDRSVIMLVLDVDDYRIHRD